MGASGPGETDQRAHNTLGQEHSKPVVCVLGTKPLSGRETVLTSGHQEGHRGLETICSGALWPASTIIPSPSSLQNL